MAELYKVHLETKR
jgi:hypothetical protein